MLSSTIFEKLTMKFEYDEQHMDEDIVGNFIKEVLMSFIPLARPGFSPIYVKEK